MKRKKILSICLFLTFLVFSYLAFTSAAQGGIQWPTDAEVGLPNPPTGVSGILINVMNWLLGIFGFIAIIAFVVSGIQYMTAAGNENVIEKAKRNMTYSIIGVIVGLAAFVIIQAVDRALRITPNF